MSRSIELNDQLFSDLEIEARAKGIPVRALVEATLRSAVPAHTPAKFTQRVHDFGAHLEGPWTVLAEIESDSYTANNEK